MSRRGAMRVLFACLMLWSTGCTTLREIPRSQYAARPERRDVRVVTTEGLRFEFDYALIRADSLVGYRRRDVEGAFDEYAVLGVPLDEVRSLSARVVDWYRTGLIGGGLIVAGITAGLASRGDDEPAPEPLPGRVE
jgi:hypothetical protein